MRTKEKVRIVISLMFLGAGPLLMRAHTKKGQKGPRGKRPDILFLLELFTYNFTLTRSKFPKE